jgi:dephospho-CoA kinase
MKHILRVGITGGIGSGKSTVAQIFDILGIPVYDADREARRLMREDIRIVNRVTELFGRESYVHGELNRKHIADIAFTNPEKLQQLNAIVHPITIRDAEFWMQRQTSAYAIKEAALIFESEAHQHLDFIIGVSAPEPLRIKRAMERDGSTREQVEARMAKQLNETEKMNRCQAVLLNDEVHLLTPQVLALHEQLLRLAAAKKD